MVSNCCSQAEAAAWNIGGQLVLIPKRPIYITMDFNTVEPPKSRHLWDQKKCLLRSGVCLEEVQNVEFVCGWDHDFVSAYGRCLLMEV